MVKLFQNMQTFRFSTEQLRARHDNAGDTIQSTKQVVNVRPTAELEAG